MGINIIGERFLFEKKLLLLGVRTHSPSLHANAQSLFNMLLPCRLPSRYDYFEPKFHMTNISTRRTSINFP